MKRYSLADYILSVKVPDELRTIFGSNSVDETNSLDNVISIGGNGSYVGRIQISLKENMWTTSGDKTGSWVHNKSLNKTGTLEVNLNQVSDKIKILIRLYETYYSSDTITEGLTITVNKAVGGGNQECVCTCTDCYIQEIPSQSFGDTAQDQTWTFTCGKIDFDSNI